MIDPSVEQHAVEIILARHLAERLTIPMFIVRPDGSASFYNEAAGRILGTRYEEAGEMSAHTWATRFDPIDADGRPLPADDLPLIIALRDGRPAYRPFSIRGDDGRAREIAVSAFPLLGLAGVQLGAFAVFWAIRRREADPPAGVADRRGLTPAENGRQDVAMILASQLADYLALPVIIADAAGTVVFYNQQAELLIGRSFDESPAIPWEAWSATFQMKTCDGEPLPSGHMPVIEAVLGSRPAHRQLVMRGLDGRRHSLSGTAVPLVGEGSRLLGALSMYWEIEV